MAGKIDAFIIGSELKGLTSVTSSPGVYPAVDKLVDLAASVKSTLGYGVKVTYAADWSEYHHDTLGWYNLDTLWASDDIDVIGIDAYFPLTNSQSSVYDVDSLKAGWESGEGYDYYFSDPARTTQAELTAAFAWKNLSWFYNHYHVNPDSSTSDWVPASKKIWFTEYGFPSVDCCSNQPNVFYDGESSGSAFPYFSKGRIDLRAQRAAIMATESYWADSDIVERKFLWTWDARPYPYWPDLLNVWNDGAAWKTGHWVQGKLGLSNLSAIVGGLCARAGLDKNMLDVTRINIPVEGYIINRQQSIRDAIEALQTAFFFDASESDHILRFIPRGGNVVAELDDDDLLLREQNERNESFRITRVQEVELPKRVNVMYLSRIANYQPATQYAERQVATSKELSTIDLPLVLSDQTAKNIADITLYNSWLARIAYDFVLPPQFVILEPADIIDVNVSGVVHRMRITSTRQVGGGIAVSAVAEDVSSYDFYQVPGEGPSGQLDNVTIYATELVLLDIPAFPDDEQAQAYLRFAVCGYALGWNGAALYRSDDNGANYARLQDSTTPATIGTCTSILADGAVCVFDEVNTLDVILLSNASLQSVSELAVLNGANAAVVGHEIIQFRTAELVGAQHYRLSGLLRGRLGTEWATASHTSGERFVLLDGALGKISGVANIIGLARNYKAVTYGSSLSSAAMQELTYAGNALKPYSPVHITGTRDGSGNLTIDWVRRTRLGGAWRDNVDVSLGEVVEAYEVDILDDDEVVRTISVNAATCTYNAAQQTTDFGGPQSSVSVRIYQLSDVIGRGVAGAAIV